MTFRHRNCRYLIQRFLVLALNAIALVIYYVAVDHLVISFKTISPRERICVYKAARFANKHYKMHPPPLATFISTSGFVRKAGCNPRMGRRSLRARSVHSDSPEASDTIEVCIGVECHCQVDCATKGFCACPARGWSQEAPNSRICHVCMGEPGALPMLNQALVAAAIKAGRAFDCTIADTAKFDRKLYFYPDTPKNYQITQHRRPIASKGMFRMLSGKTVPIAAIQMEEDAAKCIHEANRSLIDFNRAGLGLLEIITPPVFHSGEEASIFAEQLLRALRWLRICRGDMHEGHARFDINLSIRDKTRNVSSGRIEVKNLNSLKNIRQCVAAEVKNFMTYSSSIESAQAIMGTKMWDEKAHRTVPLRVKEPQYLFIEEHDIPLIRITRSDIERVSSDNRLPIGAYDRLVSIYGIPNETARVLVEFDREGETFRYFEDALSRPHDSSLLGKARELLERLRRVIVTPFRWMKGGLGTIRSHEFRCNATIAANWLVGDIACSIRKHSEVTRPPTEVAGLTIRDTYLSPGHFAELISLIESGSVTPNIVKRYLNFLLFHKNESSSAFCPDVVINGKSEPGIAPISPARFFTALNLTTISNHELIVAIARDAVALCPQETQLYRNESRHQVINHILKVASSLANDRIPPMLLKQTIAAVLAE